MRRKFILSLKVRLFGVLSVVFIILLGILHDIANDKISFDIIFVIFITIQVFLVVNNLFAFYFIDNIGLQYWSIIKRTKIKWSEVEYISIKQPAGSLLEFSVGIIFRDKKISIIPWIKDYKTLLQEVVENYQKEEAARIDSRVFEILK